MSGRTRSRRASWRSRRGPAVSWVRSWKRTIPGMLHFEIYIDDDDNEMTVLQIHPDEDSLLLHLKLAGQRIAKAYEFLEATTRIDIYGTPSDALVDQIRQMGMGAPVRFHVVTGGFSRLASVAV